MHFISKWIFLIKYAVVDVINLIFKKFSNKLMPLPWKLTQNCDVDPKHEAPLQKQKISMREENPTSASTEGSTNGVDTDGVGKKTP